MQMEVRADPAEVGRARRWARSRLAVSGIEADGPLAETLILLISELVTNAVVHTGCPAVLRMHLPHTGGAEGAQGVPGGPVAEGRAAVRGGPCGGTVRVEVTDTSARPPRQRRADGEATNGRGLELVDGLADRWGWQPVSGGKRIWCEVDRDKRLLAGEELVERVDCDREAVRVA